MRILKWPGGAPRIGYWHLMHLEITHWPWPFLQSRKR
jgi:hypothetical protein